MGHPDEQQVDAEAAQLPLGTIQAQDQLLLRVLRQELQDQPSDGFLVEAEPGQEPLAAAVVGGDVHPGVQGYGDLGQVDTADADQGQHKCGQKVQSGSMPLQVGSKNFAEFTMMIHGTTSWRGSPYFYQLLRASGKFCRVPRFCVKKGGTS